MTKGAANLQDGFLNQIRRDGGEATVVLVNGETLEGVVTGFDNFTVVLREHGVASGNDAGSRLVYKHAIAHLGAKHPTLQGASASASAKPSHAERSSAFNPIDISGVEISRTAGDDS